MVPTGKLVGDYLVEITPHFMHPESLSPCLQYSITRAQRNGTYQTVAPFSYKFAYKYVIFFLRVRRCCIVLNCNYNRVQSGYLKTRRY